MDSLGSALKVLRASTAVQVHLEQMELLPSASGRREEVDYKRRRREARARRASVNS